MPEYLSPGVYVEEVSTGPKPIEGVSTSVAGFLGPTERGPEEIRYVTSWLEFTRWYGGHLGVDQSFMSYAVQGFFDNGGKRCFVGRVLDDSAAVATLTATNGDNVIFCAYGRGIWGNGVAIRIVRASKAINGPINPVTNTNLAKDWLRVQVLYFSGGVPGQGDILDPFNPKPDPIADRNKRRPDVIEDFDDLSLDPKAPNSLVTVINMGSRLIRVGLATGTTTTTLPVLATTTGFQSLANGAGGPATDVSHYDGNTTPLGATGIADPEILGVGRGIAGMETIDGVSLLLAPDEVKIPNLTQKVITSCEKLKDRFAVLSTSRTFDPVNPKLQFDTTFGALYHPWIWVYDPVTRDDQLVPPSGHVAGIFSRTDIEQGVFKAPANAIVVGAKDLAAPLPKAVQDLLNPIGVNCIRDFRSDRRGIRLWGARTMSSDPEWRYVNVRRLFLYIEESIDEGTQWVVFEPNNDVTWGRVVRSISNFLMTIWRAGGLFGSKPEEAFFVRCDRTTMDEDDIQNGRLVCQIGICPVRPAEFVIFRIGQKTADAMA